MQQKLVLVGILALTLSAIYLSQSSVDVELQQQQQKEIQTRKPILDQIPQEIVERYIRWKSLYRPSEQNSHHLNLYRLSIFYQNAQLIEKVNSKQSSYILGETQFMDISKEEFIQTYLGILEQQSEEKFFQEEKLSLNGLNATVNWTAAGAVNSPPNQGSCGSCWAFTTVAVVEGYSFLKNGKLPQLSQQQLVDCATWEYGNLGCQGGNVYPSLGYVMNNGLTTLEAYPYTASQTKCLINNGQYKINARSNNKGCQNLLNDLQIQPTGVYVDASNWSLYKGGVFNNCGTTLNHGVIATGYDASQNWVIRNSWGPSWGSAGYMTLQGGNSTCGICENLSNAQ